MKYHRKCIDCKYWLPERNFCPKIKATIERAEAETLSYASKWCKQFKHYRANKN